MTKKWWIGLIVAVLTAVATYLTTGCASKGILNADWDYTFVENEQAEKN